MYQAVFQEEVQRTINRWRRSASAVFFTEYSENVVGTQWFVALPDKLQHTAAQSRQAQALLRA
jgi:hypothetical protein